MFSLFLIEVVIWIQFVIIYVKLVILVLVAKATFQIFFKFFMNV